MYHFEKKTLKNLEIFERKKMVLFEKVTKKTNAPSSSFENFSLFLGKIWKSWKKKLNFFFFLYIHEQSTSNATWKFWIKKNIETWNKLTNFKLNHDVANQMWSEAKLGHLLLLGPLRMLKTWWAWTLIMIFWYLLEMAWVCTSKAWALIMIFRY